MVEHCLEVQAHHYQKQVYSLKLTVMFPEMGLSLQDTKLLVISSNHKKCGERTMCEAQTTSINYLLSNVN